MASWLHEPLDVTSFQAGTSVGWTSSKPHLFRPTRVPESSSDDTSAAVGSGGLQRTVLRLPTGRDEDHLAGLVHELPMPDSARDDAGALLAEGNNLLAPCVQDDVDGPGEQDQDLVAVGVHLPMIRALGHVEGAQQATLVKSRSMLDLRPELVIDIDDLGGAVVGEVHVGIDEIEAGLLSGVHGLSLNGLRQR